MRDPRLAAAVLALAALALGHLGAWWDAHWTGVAGSGTTPVSGSAGTGGLSALLPLVGLAALLATLTLRRTGRRVMGVLLALVGLGMVALGASGAQPGAEALDEAVRATTLASDIEVVRTGQPLAYTGVAALLVGTAGWLVARPPTPRRRPDAPSSDPELADSLSSWKAMDEGRDPTQHGGERP